MTKIKKDANFKSVRWFDQIRGAATDLDEEKELNNLVDTVVKAAEYYADAYEDAKKHLLIVGKLEHLMTENTGLAFFYNGIHTDALQSRMYLDTLLENHKAKLYTWYTTDPEAKMEYGKLTATEATNLVKSNDVVEVLNDCIRLIANRQHMLEDVRDGFNNRGYNLRKITDMRIAKLEEVWIDGSRETENH